MNWTFLRTVIFAMVFLAEALAFAAPFRTTYQAKIIKPDGQPLQSSSVNFRFTILDPAASCIIYSEDYTAVNMHDSGGVVAFALGAGVRSFPTSGTAATFSAIFDNSTSSFSCQTMGVYLPTSNDGRKIVMQFNDGTGWQTLPAMTINAVPYSMYAGKAENSIQLNGKSDTSFVEYSTLAALNCQANEAIHFNGVSFSCLTAGGGITSGSVVTALGYTPADAVSFTTLSNSLSSATTNISSVSSTVFSVSSTVASLAGSVTSLQNSVATSFAAITSSQWLTSGTAISYSSGYVGLGTANPVTKLDVSGGVRISMESASCSTALAGTLRYNASNIEYCNGTTWSAFGVAGAGITNFNGSTSGTQSFATGTGGTAPNFNTSNGVHTLNIPLASTGSVTAGLLSNADYTTFTNKITSSAASIAQVLGYVPADNAVSGTYAQKANNLSDLTNIATARTNLGLGTLATANTLDVGGASATGTLAIARLPSFTGDATIAAASNTIVLANSGVTAGTYTKVIVDSKGRVTSGSAISSSDVTGALGYTPVASGSVTSSQWTATGSDIYFNAGKVGIGTSAPATALHIAGSNGIMTIERNSSDSFGAHQIFQKSRGSPVAPTIVSSDDEITTLWARGYDGSTYQTAARIKMVVDGTPGVSDMPGRIEFTTSPDGASTEQTRMVIKNDGNIGLGLTNPSAALHLKSGTSATASFKLTSGTLLTTPQVGALEYDGNNLYFTDGTSTRRTIASTAGAGTYDNASLISNSSGNITMYPNSGAGGVIVSATTASSNSSTGALVVKGGLGVAGNINAGGSVQGVSVTATSGMISPYIAGSVNASGNLTLDSTTHATKGNIVLAPNGGNVGVGMTAPAAKFSVKGTRYSSITPTNSIMQVGGGDVFLYMGAGDGVGNPYPIMLQAMRDSDSAAFPLVLNPNGGYVGIGTNSPGGPLEAVGGNTGTAYGSGEQTLILRNNSSVIGARGAGIRFDNGSYTGGGAQIDFINSGTANEGHLSFGTRYSATMTEKMRIQDNGNVGIGTTTPGSKLHVNGNIQVASTTQTVYTNNLAIFSSAADMNIYHSAADLTISSDLDETMRIKRNGRVGIGTSSPSAPLHIQNNGTTAGLVNGLFLQPNQPTNSSNYIKLGHDISTTYNAADIAFTYIGNNSNQNRLDFGFQGIAPVMAVRADGNVGIGTTTPARKLHIKDQYPYLAFEDTENTSGSVGTITYNQDGNFYFDADNPNTGSDSGFRFRANGGTKHVLTILNSGNVGMGTTTPAAKLDVSNANTFISNGTGANTYFRNSQSTNGDYLAIGWTNENVWGISSADGSTYRNLALQPYGGNVGIGTQYPDRALEVAGVIEAHDLNTGGATDGAIRIKGNSQGTPYGTIQFVDSTGATQWAFIAGNSSGNIGVGTIAPTEKLHVVGNLRVQGSTDCTLGNGAGGTNCSSDARLKENIKPIPYALEKINSLKGVEFDWNEKSLSHGRHDIGVIAQDVEKVFPTAVMNDKNTGYKKVDYAVLVAPIIQAIKELYNLVIQEKEQNLSQDRQIASIEAKVHQLETENAAKERKIQSLEQENEAIKSRLEKIEKALNSK